MTYINMSNGTPFSGLGASYVISNTAISTGVRALQTQLQRLGLLPEGRASADGHWGPRTSAALTQAARLVGFSGTPFRVSGSRVQIPDALISAIAARQAPAPTTQPGPATTPDTVGPRTVEPGAATSDDPLPESDGPGVLPRNQGPANGPRSKINWLLYGGIGAAVLTVAGIAYVVTSQSGQPVKANRRRRRR